MTSWFRSQEVSYVSLVMNEDAALNCVRELGKLGCVQFTDLNPELTPFQRRYVSQLKRCDELERKLRFFYAEIHKAQVPVQSAGSIDHFVSEGALRPESIESLETELESFEQHLQSLNEYGEKLTQTFNEKLEYKQVINKARTLFSREVPSAVQEIGANGAGESKNGGGVGPPSLVPAPSEQGLDLHAPGHHSLTDQQPLLSSDQEQGSLANLAGAGGPELRFSNITGVLNATDRVRFERMLFRATRGNCYVRFSDVDQELRDPHTGETVPKVVFIVFFNSEAIENKIKRICDAFSANRYLVPDLANAHQLPDADDSTMIDNELDEARRVLEKNMDARARLCLKLAQHVEEWQWIVAQEKANYHTLNMFKDDVMGVLRAQGWVLTQQLETAAAAIRKGHSTTDISMPSMLEVMPEAQWPQPPTYFETNKFTYAFQEFVNTYGVPRYREINPALFTAATFPFLFGVMYGDIGHGTVLFLAGLYLIITEKNAEARNLGEMLRAIYSARYMITMMGAFSMYAGFVYNDFFSLPLNLFGSSWHWDGQGSDDVNDQAEANSTSYYGDPGNVYPFGVDPAWHIADNELLFFNSLKMKISVILGVVQMTFGIILKGWNALFFGDMLDFWFEFIPMLIFDLALFGYMVIVIFVKWNINWQHRMYEATCVDGHYSWDKSKSCDSDTSTRSMCPYDYGGDGDGCQPPNLITTLINIALKPGSVEEPMFENQAELQTALLLMAFICVPVLLLVKPLILRSRHQKAVADRVDSFNSDSHLMSSEANSANRPSQAAGGDHGGGHGHGDGEFEFGEVMIHQGIETIEFVLGMISNTASYLRLWALSLAHTELAQVFWEKAMLIAIETNVFFVVFIGYGVFAAVTFGVLLMMDVMECFLHALRLHWVEFQNKFYRADGSRFEPFCFKTMLVKVSRDTAAAFAGEAAK